MRSSLSVGGLFGVLLGVLMVSAVPAAGQGPLGASGFSAVRTMHSAAPFEHVDPFSGNLLLTFTDLELPGNAGLDLRVQRVYNSKIHRDYQDTPNHFKLRTWVGMGWSLHFGRVVQSQSFTPGEPTVQMSDGSSHPLYNALDPSNPHGSWVTSQVWRYRRAVGTDPARLKLPNGLTYEFGHVGIPNGPEGVVLYVTEIRDPFNNRLTFEYFASHEGPTDGVKRIVQHLGSGLQREVTFTVTPMANGYALASMTYGTRTWTYTHVPAPYSPSTMTLLTTTSAPTAATTWSFTYRDAAPGPELLSVTGPYGGQLTYTYADVHRPVDTTTVRMRSITARNTSGTGIVPGQWTFSYLNGPLQNTSIVTSPCGQRETHTYNGIGTLGPDMGAYAGWLVGSLQRSTTETSAGTVLEERLFAWRPSAVVSGDTVTGLPDGYWASPDVFHALVGETTVNRGGAVWETEYTYSDTNYNDHFQAHTIQQWAEGAWATRRVVSRSFWYGAASTLYMPAQLSREDVYEGTEFRFSERTYASATGFNTSLILGYAGITPTTLVTSFTPTATGNVAAVTDAAGQTTTFSYSWGVPSQVQTPMLTTTRVVNADGTVASETLGTGPSALTTTYTYDALMRPTGIQGPGGTTPTAMTYGTAYDQTTRGTTYARTYPDALGRAVRQEDGDGLQTRLGLDACGRVTFASAPYTTGTGTRGVITAYDALGRVVSQVAADGTSATAFAYTGIDVAVTDALGRTTTYDYASQTGPAGARLVALTDPAAQTTTYAYNIDGALTATGGPVAGTRTWTYDLFGRPTSETHPEAGTTTFVPNAVGHITSLTNAVGQTLAFTYDANHRLTGRDGPGTASDVTITYDPLGRVASESVGGEVVTTYTYDAAGRSASRTDTTGGLTRTSTYGYDVLDRLTSVTYPSLSVAGYQYTASGRLSAVTYQGQTFATGFVHDDSGRLTSYTTGPVTHTVAYDTRDRTAGLQASSAVAGIALQLGYIYNAVSLVTGLTDHRPTHNQTFTYDALDRLTSATGPYGTLTWDYDPSGNRTLESRPGGSLTYAYDTGAGGTRRLTSVGGLQAASFAYDAAGRTTSATTTPGGTTTYGYTPAGLTSTITMPALTATQVYDASEWRIRKDVTTPSGTTRTFSLRSIGGQVLSEFEQLCTGCPVRWVRDLVYAGGRVLGASNANLSLPTVEFVQTASTVSEGVVSGKAAVAVRVTTADGLVLPQPVTVQWTVPGLGTATPGVDYATGTGSLTFPAGAASGTVVHIEVPLVNDGLYEPAETFAVQLTGVPPQVAVLGGLVTHTVSILDNDPAPTMSITGATVTESPGTVTLTVTLSTTSGQLAAAWVTPTSAAAKAGRDFVATPVMASIAPGSTTTTVTVTLLDDTYAEPTEAFTAALSALSHASPGTMTAAVTILDNDGPWVDINAALPGDYFARAWTPGEDSYVQIYNPHDVAVAARVTYVRANGAGVRREYTLAARQRLGLHVPSDPFVTGQAQGSAAVQSTDTGRPLVAELVHYAGGGWQTGESTEGVTPATSWTLAEGATGLSVGFQEWITVFNPSSEPVTAYLQYYGANGQIGGEAVAIPSGPGVFTRHVNIHWAHSEHSTVATAVGQDSGVSVPIVVERRMRWNGGLEGHSSTGQAVLQMSREFAEGGSGLFSTFVALFNPGPTTAPVLLIYRHENGSLYSQQVYVGATQRAVVGTPSWVPAGSFGLEVWATNDQPIAAERMMYAGSNWTVGHASPGAPSFGHPHWRFAEGTAGGMFETYFLIANWADLPATVTLTYRNASGTVIGTQGLVIPGYGRGTVWANAVTGGQDFTTEVTSDRNIIAERAMYWPTGSASLTAGATDLGSQSAALDSRGAALLSGGEHDSPPSPYTLTEGVPGPTYVLTDDPAALIVGKPVPGSRYEQESSGKMQIQSSGLSWYGSHLSVGKRP